MSVLVMPVMLAAVRGDVSTMHAGAGAFSTVDFALAGAAVFQCGDFADGLADWHATLSQVFGFWSSAVNTSRQAMTPLIAAATPT